MDSRSERVFAQHKTAVLEEAARRYGVSPSAFMKHGSFESFVYEFDRDGSKYILKLTHSIHRTPEMVESEIDWVRHLVDNDVWCRRSMAGRRERILHGIPVIDLDFGEFAR